MMMMPKTRSRVTLLLSLLCVVLLIAPLLSSSAGNEAYERGEALVEEQKFVDAGPYFWSALMQHEKGAGKSDYTIEEAYTAFLKTYAVRGVTEQGLVFVSQQYIQRKQAAQGLEYARQSLQVKETAEAHMLLAEHGAEYGQLNDEQVTSHLTRALDLSVDDAAVSIKLGHLFFQLKALQHALLCFERAYKLNSKSLTKSNSNKQQLAAAAAEAYANAVYMRTNLCVWGKKGAQFRADMSKIVEIVNAENSTSMQRLDSLSQQSVVHPHMTLAYVMPPALKLAVAAAHARAEQVLVKNAGLSVMDHAKLIDTYNQELRGKGGRIKVGYVSANLKSKTTVYMAQDLMALHDKSRFEVHAYATTAQDTDIFLHKAMRGVDWREKIKRSVEHFHEVQHLDVRQLSELIRQHGIHILIDWDGYSNNGVRATGLFALQSAPLQVAHQEYIGTMGASYIHYLITDATTSLAPMYAHEHYAEKFIVLPHSFLANSFAYQAPDMPPPSLTPPRSIAPHSNTACGGNLISTPTNGEEEEATTTTTSSSSFVYCNFNKQLKFDPDTFTQWLRVLQQTGPQSYLCMLENPKEAVTNLLAFTKAFDASLVPRVRFLPFINNPYDNQQRIANTCDAVLDTRIYNGHTTAAESLWAAVPVVTLGNQADMSSRVGTSILTALDLTQLIAYSDQEYEQLAVSLAKDDAFYSLMRRRLVASTLCDLSPSSSSSSSSNKRPLSPYWDLNRYVGNLENGFVQIVDRFLDRLPSAHVFTGDVGADVGVGKCPSDLKSRRVVTSSDDSTASNSNSNGNSKRSGGTTTSSNTASSSTSGGVKSSKVSSKHEQSNGALDKDKSSRRSLAHKKSKERVERIKREKAKAKPKRGTSSNNKSKVKKPSGRPQDRLKRGRVPKHLFRKAQAEEAPATSKERDGKTKKKKIKPKKPKPKRQRRKTKRELAAAEKEDL